MRLCSISTSAQICSSEPGMCIGADAIETSRRSFRVFVLKLTPENRFRYVGNTSRSYEFAKTWRAAGFFASLACPRELEISDGTAVCLALSYEPASLSASLAARSCGSRPGIVLPLGIIRVVIRNVSILPAEFTPRGKAPIWWSAQFRMIDKWVTRFLQPLHRNVYSLLN